MSGVFRHWPNRITALRFVGSLVLFGLLQLLVHVPADEIAEHLRELAALAREIGRRDRELLDPDHEAPAEAASEVLGLPTVRISPRAEALALEQARSQQPSDRDTGTADEENEVPS